VVAHNAPSLHKGIITQIFRCIFVQIASLTFSRNDGTMSTTKEKRVDTMKKKTYCYENRTFEVIVSDEYRGWLVEIWIQEVIRPNRKFFGRTKFFNNQTVDIDKYDSIDEAVRTVIANGLEKEAHGKVIDEKWKNWNEKTN
jgi:hypothetical protein